MGQGREEWASEGELKIIVGKPERVLRYQSTHMSVCMSGCRLHQAGWHRRSRWMILDSYSSCPCNKSYCVGWGLFIMQRTKEL